jgi:hypothetical protein
LAQFFHLSPVSPSVHTFAIARMGESSIPYDSASSPLLPPFSHRP